MAVKTKGRPVDRPTNGSDRGKRVFVLMAVMEARPTITREEIKSVLGWDGETLNEALRDLRLIAQESA